MSGWGQVRLFCSRKVLCVASIFKLKLGTSLNLGAEWNPNGRHVMSMLLFCIPS